jgi:hypothetical protein
MERGSKPMKPKNEKIEVYGVKGLKSSSFRKIFKNQAALEKWLVSSRFP